MLYQATRTANDDQRAEDAQRRLKQCPYPILRNVRCAMRNDVLVLTGHVPTFYAKQIAQELLRGLERISRIDNQLVVID